MGLMLVATVFHAKYLVAWYWIAVDDLLSHATGWDETRTDVSVLLTRGQGQNPSLLIQYRFR